MQSQKKSSMKPSIPIDAWEVITKVLESDPPSPDKPHWRLVAEQERQRIKEVLAHRINVYGVSYDT